MTPLIISDLIIVGFMISAGITHIFSGLKKKLNATYLLFGILSIMMGLHVLCNLIFFKSFTTDAYTIMKIIEYVNPLALLLYVLFIASYTKTKPGIPIIIISALLLLLIALNIIIDDLFMMANQGTTTYTLPWGEQIRIRIPRESNWRTYTKITLALAFIYTLYLIISQFKKPVKRMWYFITATLITWACIINDVLFINGVVKTMFIKGYGFLTFIIMMGLKLSDEILEKNKLTKILYKKEALLQSILDHIPALVFLKKINGEYEFVNDTFKKMVNPFIISDFEVESVKGMTDYDIFPKKVADLLRAEDLEVIKSKRPLNLINMRYDLEPRRYFTITKIPIFDEKQTVTDVFGFAVDVTEQVTLEESIHEIEEREKEKIALDLHDGLGQHLTGIRYLVGQLLINLKKEDSAYIIDLEEINQLLTESKDLTRELSRGLGLLILENEGFFQTIKKMMQDMMRFYDITYVFNYDEIRINKLISSNLYFIVKEIINNAINHSGATSFDLCFKNKKSVFQFIIRTNGSHFNKDISSQNGMGLKIITYRLHKINGTWDVKEMESGIEITITITKKN